MIGKINVEKNVEKVARPKAVIISSGTKSRKFSNDTGMSRARFFCESLGSYYLLSCSVSEIVKEPH